VLDLRTRSSEAGDLAHDLEAAATEFASQTQHDSLWS